MGLPSPLAPESLTFLLLRYWGQDSEGSQQRLSHYCQDDTIDTFPLAFLYIFRGEGGEPVIDFANVSLSAGPSSAPEAHPLIRSLLPSLRFCL